MTATISVILNLIQNQLDPDFHQDDISYNCHSDDPPTGGLHFAYLPYYIKPHLQNGKSLLYNDFNGRRRKTRPKT